MEEFIGRVGYICDDFPRSGHRPLAVDGRQRGQLAANDPAGSSDDSVQPIPLSLSRVAVPHTHTGRKSEHSLRLNCRTGSESLCVDQIS